MQKKHHPARDYLPVAREPMPTEGERKAWEHTHEMEMANLASWGSDFGSHWDVSVRDFLWWTGKSGFSIDWRLLTADATPWAFTFYAATLIGATLKDFGSGGFSTRPGLGYSLITTVAVVALYASFIVVWRLDSQFSPGLAVYGVTFFLSVISIGLCYRAA
jgi:hypothetical protein